MLNVVNVYTPQVGCEVGDKDKFWKDLPGNREW